MVDETLISNVHSGFVKSALFPENYLAIMICMLIGFKVYSIYTESSLGQILRLAGHHLYHLVISKKYNLVFW